MNRKEFHNSMAALLRERVQTLLDARRTSPYTQTMGEALSVLHGMADVGVRAQRMEITRARKYRRDHPNEDWRPDHDSPRPRPDHRRV